MVADRLERPARNFAEVVEIERSAHALAERLPELMLEAARISHTVTHGVHGRRRAGPGETFWQFRQYEPNDAAAQIDWRRTASSNHVYIREREWEAAHTVWLWPDLSASMQFQSTLSPSSKLDRALVISLAVAELLVRGGERVGLLGLTSPTASRTATRRLAETIATHADSPALTSGLPPAARIARFSGAILISDFLDPLDKIAEALKKIAGEDITGHLIQVLDPIEESLGYEGRMEFIEPEHGQRWIGDRVESLREEYRERLEAHRQGLREIAHRLGWTMMVHHTDRPATEPMLSLIAKLQNGGARNQA
ncbi:MAG: DUF58 domain-containing protein [Alphaproteobacteria bacterium]|nr:DUF58 domain-containing protein [Alphaproteobacteria bacterium]